MEDNKGLDTKNKIIILCIIFFSCIVIFGGVILFILQKNASRQNVTEDETTEMQAKLTHELKITQETTEEIPQITAIKLEKITTEEASDGDSDDSDDIEDSSDKNKSSDTKDSSDNNATSDNKDLEEKNDSSEEDEVDPEILAELASETNAKLMKELSDDLFSQEIIIDDHHLTVPFDYAEIRDVYDFDPADYGYEDGLVLEQGQRIAGTVDIESDSMDENVTFWAGFINDTEEDVDIKDSKVNSVRVDVRWAEAFKPGGVDKDYFTDEYPRVVLPGGITWGSTEEEVIEAYGKPKEEPYRSEDSGYSIYKYDSGDYKYFVEIVIYEDLGVSEISVRAY